MIDLDTNIEKFFQPKSRNLYGMLFRRYFMRLYNIAISRFTWTGLPDEILPSFLEKTLLDLGNAVFYLDEPTDMYSIMSLAEAGKMDNYGHGNMRFAYSINGMTTLDKTNSVELHDNLADYPMKDHLMMYADSLAKIRIVRDININAQKTPIIFTGPQSMKSTVVNAMNDYDIGVDYLPFKKSAYEGMEIQALDTKAPVVFDKLQYMLESEITDCLTLLGIDASNIAKKERAVTGEITGNNGQCEANRNSYMSVRKRACDQINRMFGLNLSVQFNTEIPIFNDKGSKEDMMGGEHDGNDDSDSEQISEE